MQVSDDSPAVRTAHGWSLEQDEASLTAWTTFLRDYAKGIGQRYPTRPPLSPAQLYRLGSVSDHSDKSAQFEDAPLYSSTTVTPDWLVRYATSTATTAAYLLLALLGKRIGNDVSSSTTYTLRNRSATFSQSPISLPPTFPMRLRRFLSFAIEYRHTLRSLDPMS
jgi:hypothetical protein